jgi:hypothetical protein
MGGGGVMGQGRRCEGSERRVKGGGPVRAAMILGGRRMRARVIEVACCKRLQYYT